ncbi:hypothetical protein [Parvularcula maris]|uniref:Uncharacterized protein n=1 Tax=Parvularcula maris TaxID=2965077 RepID=A0A9X2RIF6_9PROT|nr:hypothetical protein [Parvularcula maris]MCQ8185939.1 hypothetical protein [Parvularcula maris]
MNVLFAAIVTLLTQEPFITWTDGIVYGPMEVHRGQFVKGLEAYDFIPFGESRGWLVRAIDDNVRSDLEGNGKSGVRDIVLKSRVAASQDQVLRATGAWSDWQGMAAERWILVADVISSNTPHSTSFCDQP